MMYQKLLIQIVKIINHLIYNKHTLNIIQASKGYTVGAGSAEAVAEPPKRRKASGKPLSEAHRAAISKTKKAAALKQKARWVGEHPPTAPDQIGEEPAGAQSLSELTSKL